MNSRIAATLGAVAVCVAVATAVVGYDADHTEQTRAVSEPATGIVKEQQDGSEPTPQEAESTPSFPGEPVYWLRESDGRLGVFVEDSHHPEMVLDVYLSSLPLSDRQALQQGVCAGSYRQLIAMIEDYIS